MTRRRVKAMTQSNGVDHDAAGEFVLDEPGEEVETRVSTPAKRWRVTFDGGKSLYVYGDDEAQARQRVTSAVERHATVFNGTRREQGAGTGMDAASLGAVVNVAEEPLGKGHGPSVDERKAPGT
jgi:hypothetical protein